MLSRTGRSQWCTAGNRAALPQDFVPDPIPGAPLVPLAAGTIIVHIMHSMLSMHNMYSMHIIHVVQCHVYYSEPGLNCTLAQNKPKLIFLDVCERTVQEGGTKVDQVMDLPCNDPWHTEQWCTAHRASTRAILSDSACIGLALA